MTETNDRPHSVLKGSIEQLNAMAQEIVDEYNRLNSAPEGVILKSIFETDEQYRTRCNSQK